MSQDTIWHRGSLVISPSFFAGAHTFDRQLAHPQSRAVARSSIARVVRNVRKQAEALAAKLVDARVEVFAI